MRRRPGAGQRDLRRRDHQRPADDERGPCHDPTRHDRPPGHRRERALTTWNTLVPGAELTVDPELAPGPSALDAEPRGDDGRRRGPAGGLRHGSPGGAASGERAASVLMWNWSRGDADGPPDEGALSARAAREIVARDHGFSTWPTPKSRCDPVFEHAVDAVVMGRSTSCAKRSPSTPSPQEAAHPRAPRRAAALHDREWRRDTPADRPASRRADRAAASLCRCRRRGQLRSYGGSHDTLWMPRSSGHPPTQRRRGCSTPRDVLATW
jgi:hypothetical protein